MYPPPPPMSRPVPLVRAAELATSSPPVSTSTSPGHHPGHHMAGYDIMPPILPPSEHHPPPPHDGQSQSQSQSAVLIKLLRPAAIFLGTNKPDFLQAWNSINKKIMQIVKINTQINLNLFRFLPIKNIQSTVTFQGKPCRHSNNSWQTIMKSSVPPAFTWEPQFVSLPDRYYSQLEPVDATVSTAISLTSSSHSDRTSPGTTSPHHHNNNNSK